MSQKLLSQLGSSQTIGVVVALVVLCLPVGTQAQTCNADWNQPVVCGVRVGVAAPGDRLQEIMGDEPIAIPAGGVLDLQVQGTDQFGRVFPASRMRPELEEGLGCSGLIAWEPQDETQFRLTAGTRRGICRLVLWIPGNLNLEWELDIEVVSAVASGYSRAQAELVVTALYRGILGREADPAGLQNQVAEVVRGRLENVVVGMYGSNEFLTQRSSREPMEQLDDLYRALLGREVDSAGVRSHLADVERRRYPVVALRILQSPEFEETLIDATID